MPAHGSKGAPGMKWYRKFTPRRTSLAEQLDPAGQSFTNVGPYSKYAPRYIDGLKRQPASSQMGTLPLNPSERGTPTPVSSFTASPIGMP
jgi:hypothetical protein